VVRGYTANKEQLTNRLARIEGQVRGVSKMIDEDRYCMDVLSQINAIRAAIDKVALGLLDAHARHCLIGQGDGPSDPRRTSRRTHGRPRTDGVTLKPAIADHPPEPSGTAPCRTTGRRRGSLSERPWVCLRPTGSRTDAVSASLVRSLPSSRAGPPSMRSTTSVLDRWWIWTVALTGWAATEAFRNRGQASS